MPPRRSLAGRLIVGLAGPGLLAPEAAWLLRWRPAGVILFSRNVTGAEQLAGLCRELRAVLAPAAEIVADHEGGPVAPLASALGRPPAAWSLGTLDDPQLTRLVHRQTAAAARAAGLDRLLAPCADVLSEPANPVIGARAFGADASLVSRHVAAAVAGLREGGVAACPKHWPGHGGSGQDSHDGPVRPPAAAGGKNEEPFRSGVAAGADAIMLGHLPGADAEAPALPATLSRTAAARARALAPGGGGLLLLADDVTMGALAAELAGGGASGLVDPAELPRSWFAAVAAAGCDRLLCRGIPWRAFPLAGAAARRAVAESAEARAAPPPGGRAPTPSAATDFGAGAAEEPEGPPAYAEARRRIARAGAPWPPAAAALLWLDATAGDRWGAAALGPLLRQRFARLEHVGGERQTGSQIACIHGNEEPLRALLVTSHRPLRPDTLAALAGRALAPEGGCLVMGHPSLAADAARLLPRAWKLLALHDVRPADLAPALGTAGSRVDSPGGGG